MTDPKAYPINEIFRSVQGEGLNSGRDALFIRFSGCNLACRKEVEGFDCDTEFTSSVRMTTQEIVDRILCEGPEIVVLTGGEPLLHLDEALLSGLREIPSILFCVETNGTRPLPEGADFLFVSCSPKTAEHTLRVGRANELRYVRSDGQGEPRPSLTADAYFVSPAWDPSTNRPERGALAACLRIIQSGSRSPRWRLSMQYHKVLGER